MEKIIDFFGSPPGIRMITIIAGIIIVVLIAGFIKKLIPRYISEVQTRYRLRKFINFLAYTFVALIIIIVYSNQITGLTVFLGVAGAGITFALQEVIVSIAGFIAINTTSFFKVGDRVLLGGIKGDVVDIAVLRTSLMEIGDWVDGDLYNGRVVRVANSFIFKEPVYNYSGDFPFLWDEIRVPVKTTSDFEYARNLFSSILEEVQGEYAEEIRKHWDKMTKKLLIEKARIKPLVSMTFDENWITFTLRYVVDYKARRMTKDTISTRVLNTIRQSEGRIEVATAAFEISRADKA
jgi:small-conductance mechanosensitive channel